MAEEQTQGKGLGLGFGCFMVVVMGGAMITLVVVLTRGHADGRKAIEAYVASVKGGTDATPAAAGLEADAVTKAVRASTSFSVSNFQSQHDTSCFWVTLHGGGADVDAQFVLGERASKTEVTAVSLKRSCDCPDDASQACHLE